MPKKAKRAPSVERRREHDRRRPGRVGRVEQGEAHPGNSARRSGLELELS